MSALCTDTGCLEKIEPAIQKLSKPIPHTAPGHLRAAAYLYGVETVPLEHARVLELGCETGGNLLPFALACPKAQVVGVDLWPGNVHRARESALEQGAGNLVFHNRLFTEIDKDFGEFDYIIVHDQFTWAPSASREAILRICRENLAPLGIAYVSYNTYPGWKAGDILRDAMQLHNHFAQSMEEVLAGAAAMLQPMSDGIAKDNHEAASLRTAVKKISERPDYYLNNEFLQSTTASFYFIEFAEAAAQIGLAYVGDATPQEEISATYGANVQLNQSLVALGQPKIMRQQYLDFAVGREFRRSLLTHHERAATIANVPDLSRFTELNWAASVKQANINTAPGKPATFSNSCGKIFEIADDTAIRICNMLASVWPMSVTQEQLVAAVQGVEAWLHPEEAESINQEIQRALEVLFKMGVLDYRLEVGPYNECGNNALRAWTNIVGPSAEDVKTDILCGFNLWHKPTALRLTATQTRLLQEIDGKHNAGELLALSARIVQSDTGEEHAVISDDKPVLELAQLVLELRMQGALKGSDAAWLGYFTTMLSAEGLPAGTRMECLSSFLEFLRRTNRRGRKASSLKTTMPFKNGSAGATPVQHNLEALKTFNHIQTLRRQKRFSDAAPIARRLAAAHPDECLGWHILGILLREMGETAQSVSPLLKALSLQPANVAIYADVGATLQTLKERRHAEALLRYALDIDPRYIPNWLNLGNLLRGRDTPALAETCYRNALAISPQDLSALNNLSTVLGDQGHLEESIDCLRKIIASQRDNYMAHSNLLFMLSQYPGISASDLFKEHRAFGLRLERDRKSRASAPNHTNLKDPDRSLRVGFVSGDLCSHAVANFLEPVWQAFNKQEFELYAYDNTPFEDAVTQRLKAHIKTWRKIRPLSDHDLARLIEQDRIDVLIDLSGHTAHNRLPMFGLKPAPIQISWIGYPGTTGLKAMDYYFVNKHQAPGELLDTQFTEKLVRIPATFAFEPSSLSPEVNPLPCLETDYFTFGSFNRISKINATVLHTWASILKQTPKSRMLLGGIFPGIKKALKKEFERLGVSSERLFFQPRTSIKEYLTLHHQVDLLLDAFPYSGGTTTMHGLWMGVPTLTLAGNSMPSRTGAAIMGTINLDEFIVTTEADYISSAASLATNTEYLAEIRAGLRARLRASSFLSPGMTASSIEQALRYAWGQWCAGKTAEGFQLGSDSAVRGCRAGE